jgi:cytidyltransferase-like protein
MSIDIVRIIHNSPYKVVMAITGGGAESIGELLRHGNGSATLLHADVPYNQAAFVKYIGGVPDKFCSPEAARDLAMAAFKKSLDLAPEENSNNLIGLGASCSLLKPNGERHGRQHNAYIAVQTTNFTKTYEFCINSEQLSTREEQESFVSDKVLRILAHAMNWVPQDYISASSIFYAKPNYLDIILGKKNYISFTATRDSSKFSPQNRVIFPGSFFPIHEGHLKIAEKAAELTKKKVDFEVCVHNVDKPSMNFQSVDERLETMQTSLNDKPYFESILFTSRPTFVSKAEVFPNSTFVVGWDTFKRIADPKYYGGLKGLNSALEQLRQFNTQFLVFHRIIEGKSSVDEPIDSIPSELHAMSRICGEDILPVTNFSSKAIRNCSN